MASKHPPKKLPKTNTVPDRKDQPRPRCILTECNVASQNIGSTSKPAKMTKLDEAAIGSSSDSSQNSSDLSGVAASLEEMKISSSTKRPQTSSQSSSSSNKNRIKTLDLNPNQTETTEIVKTPPANRALLPCPIRAPKKPARRDQSESPPDSPLGKDANKRLLYYQSF